MYLLLSFQLYFIVYTRAIHRFLLLATFFLFGFFWKHFICFESFCFFSICFLSVLFCKTKMIYIFFNFNDSHDSFMLFFVSMSWFFGFYAEKVAGYLMGNLSLDFWIFFFSVEFMFAIFDLLSESEDVSLYIERYEYFQLLCL